MSNYAGRSQRGVTLVELMIALVIGTFLIAGAATLFAKQRDLYRTNESAARLQETARYALSTIEADVRMANYWGLNNRPDLITGRAGPGEAVPSELSAYETGIDLCGDNWAINLDDYVEATNASYDLDCDPVGDVVADTDVLVSRRASVEAYPVVGGVPDIAGTGGVVKVAASRNSGAVFADDVLPTGFSTPTAEIRPMTAHAYYVSEDSVLRDGVPTLRRKGLGSTGGAVTVTDEEVVPFVEDLQVQLGIDRNGDQNAEFFAEPGFVLGAGEIVVAVRVWILARAEEPEVGFTDDRTYTYADRVVTPADSFRRLLVSKTIQLRNTRR